MSTNPYAHYSVNDFDTFDCLKMSISFYCLLIFVLRGYVVWLMSVANLQDKTLFINWFFPAPQTFYMSLLSGVLGLFVGGLFILRKPNAKPWVKKLWPYARVILMIAIYFDLTVSFIAYYLNYITAVHWVVGHTIVVILGSWACYKNKRLTLNLREFPQPKTSSK